MRLCHGVPPLNRFTQVTVKFLKSELSCLVFIYYLQINENAELGYLVQDIKLSFFLFVILLSVLDVFFFITGVPVDEIMPSKKLDRIKLGTSVYI